MAERGPLDPSVSDGKRPSAPERSARLLPRRGRSPLPIALASAGMVARALRVQAPDVVYVKGLLEASDGLANLFAERGGDLVLVAPIGRENELAELIEDLVAELGAELGPCTLGISGSPTLSA